MKSITKCIKETAKKLQKAKLVPVLGPALSYAQALCTGYVRVLPAISTPLLIFLKEEKSVIIKITNKEDTRNIKNQLRKNIV